jgi:hypothetical protein
MLEILEIFGGLCLKNVEFLRIVIHSILGLRISRWGRPNRILNLEYFTFGVKLKVRAYFVFLGLASTSLLPRFT